MSPWTDRPPHQRAGHTVRRVAVLRLRGRAGPLRARVCWPAPSAQAAPALLVFFPAGHGQYGLRRADPACRGLCAQAGLVVVAVPHRPVPHQAVLDDAVSALEWAASHAAELDADPARLLAGGEGAGGGLAAAVALHARDDRWPTLVRQLLITPRFLDRATSDGPDGWAGAALDGRGRAGDGGHRRGRPAPRRRPPLRRPAAPAGGPTPAAGVSGT